jgi:phage portal protein BeeE
VSLSLDEYLQYFNQGLNNPYFTGPTTTLGQKQEEIRGNFEGYVYGAYRSNGIVFACILARLMLFSEARFQFRRRVNGRPGELFGTKALESLEEPWPGGTTGDLLTRVIQDVDLGGNYFAARRDGGRIKRMRPDWVTIVLGSKKDASVGFGDVDAEVLGYIYEPGGKGGSGETDVFLREEVAHFAPIPDPLAAFRGMSWLTPVLREIMGDLAATEHKLKYFENGATPNLVVSIDASVQKETFKEWVDLFDKKYSGAANAYKTMYLGAGAKAEAVGADLKNVDFQQVQGAGENRIAVAAGVPAIIVSLSEGLKAATLANYGQARRHFADATMRPLWRGVAGAFSNIIQVPAGAELWYDDRDISYLQADRSDEAEIQQKEAVAAKTYIEAGYDPDSVVAALTANDMSRLTHTGLVSVQLQKPGAQSPSTAPAEEPPAGE